MPVGNSISSHQNTCSGHTISATNTATNTCHHHHLKSTATATAAVSVAAISSDDSVAGTTSTETVLQVPTRTTHQQQHNLGHCSSVRPTTTTTTISSNSNTLSEQRQEVAVASRQPMTGSQAALISPADSKTVAVVERSAAPVAQVPQSRTFPRRDEDCCEIVLFEDECYFGADGGRSYHSQEDLDCQLPSSTTSFSVLQQNSANMSLIESQQQRRNPVIGLSGSQPSLTGTLAAFVTGSNGSHQHFSHHHSHQHNQQQPSGKRLRL